MELREDLHAIVEKIAKGVLRAKAEEIDQNSEWPEESIRALQHAGLGGLTVPKKYGGHGGGLLAMVQASEILGKECGSAAMCFGMHCVGAAVISVKATDDQVDRFLKPIVEGRHLTTLSLSEPGTGAFFYIPELKMKTLSEDHFELNGSKSFVTNGSYADSFVTSTMSIDSDLPVGEFSLVVVPSGSEGLEWHSPWQGFGMRGNASANVTYNGVRVPKANLLGHRGDQLWYVFEVVAPYFLMSMAGTYLGIADAALTEAIDHLKNRTYSHSGSSPSHSSVMQHRIGQLWSRLQSTRQLVYHAAARGDGGDANALPAILSSKAEVADCATLIANEAMSLVGGKGYGESGKLGRLLRDARAAHVMSPTTDMLRTWTGRALLGAPLLSEG